MTEKDPTGMAKSTPYWICCSCDAPLSCAACGVEQPNDNDEIARLTAALSRAEKALKEIDDLPSVQQDEGPMIARRALLSISEPVK